MRRWSLDARSEGQSSHPLVSEPFAHEWREADKIRTSEIMKRAVLGKGSSRTILLAR
jgi:hypothetical protein